MYREIEIKYDVPLKVDEARLLERFTELLAAEKFVKVAGEKVSRVYTYFDTKEGLAYKRGETIRRVEGFHNGKSKGKYRYDYKKGSLADRYEQNEFAEELLSGKQMLKLLGLNGMYAGIEDVAVVDTIHHKATFSREKVRLDVKVDYFSIRGGGKFKEIEVELGKESGGEYEHLLEDLGRRILLQKFGLDRVQVQKYARVGEMRGKR